MWLAVAASFTLRDLAFVVREDQILSSRVNIERRPEEFLTHAGAFDVPPGEPLAPRRVPSENVIGVLTDALLPEREVRGMFLLFFHFNARTGVQVAECISGK